MDPLEILLLLPLLCYVLFWIVALAKVMQLDPDDLPGPYDKWLWILIHIFFAPIAPLIVVAYFLTMPKQDSKRPASNHAGNPRTDIYREQIKKLRRENRTLKNKLTEPDCDTTVKEDPADQDDSDSTSAHDDEPPATRQRSKTGDE